MFFRLLGKMHVKVVYRGLKEITIYVDGKERLFVDMDEPDTASEMSRVPKLMKWACEAGKRGEDVTVEIEKEELLSESDGDDSE